MKAAKGDWIIVNSAHVGEPLREGLIVTVRHADGSPPYVVRWTDTDEESLVFPGPDAHVEHRPPHMAGPT